MGTAPLTAQLEEVDGDLVVVVGWRAGSRATRASQPPCWRPPVSRGRRSDASWSSGTAWSPGAEASATCPPPTWPTAVPSRAAGGLSVSPGGGSSALADRVSAPTRLRIRLAAMRTRRRRRFMPVERGPTRAWRGAPAFGAAWRGVRSERIGIASEVPCVGTTGRIPREASVRAGGLVGTVRSEAGDRRAWVELATRQREKYQVSVESVKSPSNPSDLDMLQPRRRHWMIAVRSTTGPPVLPTNRSGAGRDGSVTALAPPWAAGRRRDRTAGDPGRRSGSRL